MTIYHLNIFPLLKGKFWVMLIFKLLALKFSRHALLETKKKQKVQGKTTFTFFKLLYPHANVF